MVSLSQLSLTPVFDNNGSLVRNARLYFYRPGTLDPLTVYQDQELGAPHTQPIVTGGSGRIPPIYVGDAPQRVRIFDNANQLVEDIPWLPGATDTGGTGGGGGGSPGVADTALVPGDVVWSFSTGSVRSGWVRLNGGTIGNALSGASERANDDAHALFVFLWGQDPAGNLPVTPSRGASAESDWLANKRIELPDARSMILGGISTMGRPAATILGTQNVISKGSLAHPGSRLGEALHVLTINEMPAHTHAVTDPGHTHTATQASHTHGITDNGHGHSVSDPSHAHSISDPGHGHGVNDPGHKHGAAVMSAAGTSASGSGKSAFNRESMETSVAGTGIWLSGSGTGIGIYGAYTGVTVVAATTGITINSATPSITVQSKVTGITNQNNGGGGSHNIVQPTLLGTWYMKL